MVEKLNKGDMNKSYNKYLIKRKENFLGDNFASKF